MLRYLPLIVLLGVVIYALIDCATTKKEDAKHLPKIVWLLLIVLFPLLGSIGWLIAGRNRRRLPPGGSGGGTGGGRRSTWVAPDDNPEFLKKLGDENAKGDEGKSDDGDDESDGDGDGKRDGDPREK
ncbi:PLDc N-terminal domain-containing protein [Streptomyces sp. NBC_01808]|uniref:PLDc N-terminal domain-containing protein n=1 Tax=Streptomyces sp. NBC_01808 TaxID=2975947 RepID=UPI002DD801A7|nr:PLDc N-terminal domain-containing protein [Streptomyces sp. NBC_01808]WSA39742.1 PLDc N-terminal domain-containing protein [Streptomyces sp. NBC_01808]